MLSSFNQFTKTIVKGLIIRAAISAPVDVVYMADVPSFFG
jgi:hypothetical protein